MKRQHMRKLGQCLTKYHVPEVVRDVETSNGWTNCIFVHIAIYENYF